MSTTEYALRTDGAQTTFESATRAEAMTYELPIPDHVFDWRADVARYDYIYANDPLMVPERSNDEPASRDAAI